MKKSLMFGFSILILSLFAIGVVSAANSCENRLCKIYLNEEAIVSEGNSFRAFQINDIELGLRVNGIQARLSGVGESRLVGNLEIVVKERGNDFIEFSFLPITHITEEGSYIVKKGYTIELNDVSAEVREISWGLQEDTEPRLILDGNNAQSCFLHTGESCELVFGAVTHPTSKNLKITVISIEKNEESQDDSLASIAILKIKEDIIPEEEPLEIPETTPEGVYFCQGCELENQCYPLGYRKANQYCSDLGGTFKTQVEKGTCENNFECNSNVCVNSECISPGFLQKILNWFKKLFGQDNS